MSDWPLISLVTPSMNQAHFLEATLESVFAQGYPRLEYVVVDGGSSDGSVDILRKHASRLTWWVSEPDAGQADAIEKGFARCSGTVMNWLNSDDLLRPGALFAVARAWKDGQPDLIAGRSRDFTDDPEQVLARFEPAGYDHPDCLRFWDGRFRYHQPCTFFSRSAYERAGSLDRGLHYVMDYDFYCRVLALPGVRARMLDDELSAFRQHPEAKTSRAPREFLRELCAVSRRRWPPGWGADEQHAMDRYCAECAAFQAAAAARNHAWRQSVTAVTDGLGYQPAHFARFMARRMLAVLRR